MTKIYVTEDCGNAPKKEYIREFNIAFAEADVEKILSMFSDDAEWVMVGNTAYHGKIEIEKALRAAKLKEAEELLIDNILSHGNRCSANGMLVFKDVSIHFSDVYTFSRHAADAKIKKLISYAIESEPQA